MRPRLREVLPARRHGPHRASRGGRPLITANLCHDHDLRVACRLMIDEHTSVGSRHVLCVLGAGLDLDEVEAIAETEGFELDWEYSGHAPDPRMPAAFEACGAGASFTALDWEAVRGH